MSRIPKILTHGLDSTYIAVTLSSSGLGQYTLSSSLEKG
jgi:hypothetical protein